MLGRTTTAAIALLLGACSAPPSDGSSDATAPVAASSAPSPLPAASASAEPAAPKEPTVARDLPAEEDTPEPKERSPHDPIGTFDDWIAAYEGLGAAELEDPPRLRQPKDLAIESGLQLRERPLTSGRSGPSIGHLITTSMLVAFPPLSISTESRSARWSFE